MMCRKLTVCIAALTFRCISSVLLSDVAHAAEGSSRSRAGDSSVLMMVAGISAREEMCLVAQNGLAHLDSCSRAIAVGDGRELWSLQSGGQLKHIADNQCASAAKSVSGEAIVLVDCDAAGLWKLLPNGQVQVGELCLSQAGQAVDMENLALGSAAQATSSADSVQHGASSAVDADVASFWASKFDEAKPVVFSLDLGETRDIDQVSIVWAYPPKSFSLETSVDGEKWVEEFATTTNMVSVTRVLVGKGAASKVRVVMRETHPLFGRFAGHALYGIKSISVLAPGLRAVLADCAIASQSEDARDKYFASYVPTFDPAPLAALQAATPALDAAATSLSSALSEVVATFPKLSECGTTKHAGLALLNRSSQWHASVSAVAGMLGSTDGAHGVDADSVEPLLASARVAIRSLRDALG